MRNRRRYWELKEEAEDRKNGNECLIIEHKDEIQVIFHKFKDLLISSIPCNSKTFRSLSIVIRLSNLNDSLRRIYFLSTRNFVASRTCHPHRFCEYCTG